MSDELQEVPPNGGWGAFNLLLHSVVWFAYRTKHMDKWPRNAQACYQNGFTVPALDELSLKALIAAAYRHIVARLKVAE